MTKIDEKIALLDEYIHIGIISNRYNAKHVNAAAQSSIRMFTRKKTEDTIKNNGL